jgi:hypothetical protein
MFAAKRVSVCGPRVNDEAAAREEFLLMLPPQSVDRAGVVMQRFI